MHKLIYALTLLLCFAPLPGSAQDNPPADNPALGLWKNLDDVSGKPKALIRIFEQGGILQGRIEKLFREPGEEQNPVCKKCEGALKDQPTLGMTILTGFTRNGNEYSGGTILDPENGKTYQSRMSVEDNGKKLNVRGYIGIPLFGRSQTWLREQ